MKDPCSAFSRAEYEQIFRGLQPQTQISIALPLSVGMGSVCEVMDFRLRHDATDLANSLAADCDAAGKGIEIINV